MNYNQAIASIFILYSLVLCLCFSISFTYLHHYLPRKQYAYAQFDFASELSSNYYIDQVYAHNLIVSLFPKTIAIIDYIKLPKQQWGKSYIFANKIEINQQITGWQTLETLTHELLHITHKIHDEYYIQFLTFKVLYESNNPILVLKAKDMAYRICTLGSRKNTQYDCSWYIAQYLEEHII